MSLDLRSTWPNSSTPEMDTHVCVGRATSGELRPTSSVMPEVSESIGQECKDPA